MPWTALMKVRFLKSKYQTNSTFYSSSIWSGIKDYYDTISENTFWDDLWCLFRCISLIILLLSFNMLGMVAFGPCPSSLYKLFELYNLHNISIYDSLDIPNCIRILLHFYSTSNCCNILPSL